MDAIAYHVEIIKKLRITTMLQPPRKIGKRIPSLENVGNQNLVAV